MTLSIDSLTVQASEDKEKDMMRTKTKVCDFAVNLTVPVELTHGCWRLGAGSVVVGSPLCGELPWLLLLLLRPPESQGAADSGPACFCTSWGVLVKLAPFDSHVLELSRCTCTYLDCRHFGAATLSLYCLGTVPSTMRFESMPEALDATAMSNISHPHNL